MASPTYTGTYTGLLKVFLDRLGHWRDMAQIAERATFDSLFLADGPAVRANPEFRPASQFTATRRSGVPEPVA